VSALRLTVGWLAAAVAGRIVSGDPERVVGNITTDSRSLQGGDFFIALRGARFDAHAFVNEVLERGALGVLVEEIPARDFAPDTVVIAANDTTRALQDLAHAVREATATKVVAITGSAGKTTTKDTIADFLSASHRVVKNKGNLNNHIACRCRCCSCATSRMSRSWNSG
jgi:UDP-N-acetylmuramoyl-tripeptide--D-alanyl-D-alanine ligase